jgi:hypothetical protein
MKTYGGSGRIAPRNLNLGTRWRGVVSFTPPLLYPQRKNRRYPLDKRLGGPQSQFGRGGGRKKWVSGKGHKLWSPTLCSFLQLPVRSKCLLDTLSPRNAESKTLTLEASSLGFHKSICMNTLKSHILIPLSLSLSLFFLSFKILKWWYSTLIETKCSRHLELCKLPSCSGTEIPDWNISGERQNCGLPVYLILRNVDVIHMPWIYEYTTHGASSCETDKIYLGFASLPPVSSFLSFPSLSPFTTAATYYYLHKLRPSFRSWQRRQMLTTFTPSAESKQLSPVSGLPNTVSMLNSTSTEIGSGHFGVLISDT